MRFQGRHKARPGSSAKVESAGAVICGTFPGIA
jgi:hypothetical protein